MGQLSTNYLEQESGLTHGEQTTAMALTMGKGTSIPFRGNRELLHEGAKVSIIGGGPAGAFFAIHLLRGARRLNRRCEVTIIEKKRLLNPDQAPWLNRGCNFCAGGISPRLHEVLHNDGIIIPAALIQEDFSLVWIQGHWKNFPIKIPDNAKMYSVYRGSLPHKRGQEAWGFDASLLKIAADEGAQIISGEVEAIRYDSDGLPLIFIRTPSRATLPITADFAVLAAGINMRIGKAQGENPLVHSIQQLNPRFAPAKVRKTLIFELHVGRAYLTKHLHKAVYFIEYGSRDLPLEHIALVPKGDYLTVSLIGKSIDKAVLPEDARAIIRKFLSLSQIRSIIPNIPFQETVIACICFPWIAIRPAKFPFADRLAVIGDAAGSRLYKDGLYSAYYTAKTLAEAVLLVGIDRKSLFIGYNQALKWLAGDNFFGRWVFRLTRLTFSTNFISRIFYQAFATELKIRDKSQRPIGVVLWKIASGTADYREILREMFSLSVLNSLFIGGVLVTLRNMATEVFFGLRWGDYGRYPTVIVKEKLKHFKSVIGSPLGLKWDGIFDFERMYAIKVCAPLEDVFSEIIQFGNGRWNFLNLRFVEIKRIEKDANGLGTVIRYRIKGLGLGFDLRLAAFIPDKILLYEVSDGFVDRGQLIFSLDRMVDGNCRFVIFTAFDFKKGKNAFTRLFWRLFRLFFPAYVHDVVWNYALCRIKETVENRIGLKL